MATVPRARSTLMASPTTSGPMPSPPITASRMLRWATPLRYWAARDNSEPLVFVQIDDPGQTRTRRVGDLAEQLQRDRRVCGQHQHGVPALSPAADLHAADVDLVAAEDLADCAHDPWPVDVAEEDHVLGRRDLRVEAVDLDEALREPQAGQCAAHRDQLAVRRGAANGEQVAPVLADPLGAHSELDAALLGDQWGVHVRNGLLGHCGEQARHGCQLEDAGIKPGDLALGRHGHRRRRTAGEGRKDPAELLAERQPWPQVLGYRAALHVDSVWHELAIQRQPDRPGDLDAGLLLGL